MENWSIPRINYSLLLFAMPGAVSARHISQTGRVVLSNQTSLLPNRDPGKGREPPISMMALKAMDPFCLTIDPGLRRDDSNGMIDSRVRGRAADYVNPTEASAGMTRKRNRPLSATRPPCLRCRSPESRVACLCRAMFDRLEATKGTRRHFPAF
jgi:hypothetical protein